MSKRKPKDIANRKRIRREMKSWRIHITPKLQFAAKLAKMKSVQSIKIGEIIYVS